MAISGEEFGVAGEELERSQQRVQGLLWDMDLLRGVSNLGELGLKMYDKRLFQQNIYPDLQTRVQSVVGEGAFGELEAQSQSVLQLTNSQHDKDRAEPSTGQRFEDSALEKRAYALLRKQIRNKEAHSEGVAEARQTLFQGMTYVLTRWTPQHSPSSKISSSSSRRKEVEPKTGSGYCKDDEAYRSGQGIPEQGCRVGHAVMFGGRTRTDGT